MSALNGCGLLAERGEALRARGCVAAARGRSVCEPSRRRGEGLGDVHLFCHAVVRDGEVQRVSSRPPPLLERSRPPGSSARMPRIRVSSSSICAADERFRVSPTQW